MKNNLKIIVLTQIAITAVMSMMSDRLAAQESTKEKAAAPQRRTLSENVGNRKQEAKPAKFNQTLTSPATLKENIPAPEAPVIQIAEPVFQQVSATGIRAHVEACIKNGAPIYLLK